MNQGVKPAPGVRGRSSVGMAMTGVQHACATPVSDEQLWEMSARFIADGLKLRERVVYFEDDSAEQVLARLADDEVATRGPLRSGQLAIAPATTTRAALSSVAQLEASLRAAVDESFDLGYRAVRITSQASHGMRISGEVGMRAFDAAAQRVLARYPGVRMLCFYDQRRYQTDSIENLVGLHRYRVCCPAVYDDALLRVTATGPHAVRLAGEIDHSNCGMISRLLAGVLDELLRSDPPSTSATVDLSSLRFLDVGGAAALIHAAEGCPSTHRLVLRGVSPRVTRVLERCGAPFSPQLEVHTRD